MKEGQMTCEVCHQHPATVHYSQMVNGEFTEAHMCESCAKDRGMTVTPFASHFSVGDLLSGLLQSAPQEGGPAKPVKSKLDRCVCGLTAEEFKKTGFLGCPECYKTFKKSLTVLLRQIHGSTDHLGASPAFAKAPALTKTERIKRLKKSLAKAIDEERFEEAASLRDQLKALEEPADA